MFRSAMMATVLLFLAACNAPEKEEQSAEEFMKPHQVWEYDQSHSQMDDSVIKTAAVSSSRPINLAPPYDGIQYPRLVIRNGVKDKDVIFIMNNAQIVCDVYTCPIRIRIDDDAPISVDATRPSDYSTNAAFLPIYSKLMKRLPTAKRLKLEFTQYSDGVKTVEFNVSNFQPERIK